MLNNSGCLNRRLHTLDLVPDERVGEEKYSAAIPQASMNPGSIANNLEVV